jgi:hypothetical protein
MLNSIACDSANNSTAVRTSTGTKSDEIELTFEDYLEDMNHEVIRLVLRRRCAPRPRPHLVGVPSRRRTAGQLMPTGGHLAASTPTFSNEGGAS